MVMKSWRDTGGEPDIGLDLPRWLEELDFEIKSLHPIIHVVPRANYIWQWPAAFIDVGIRRLVDLDHLTPERARVIAEAIAAREAAPGTLVITPAVLEIIAIRR